MAIDLTALKNEIETDPQGLGYADKNDGEIAALLNQVGLSSETLEPSFATPVDMQASVVGSEYIALSASEQRAWGAIVGLGTIPIDNTNLRVQIQQIWAAGTTTRTNLVALQTRDASRAEILFGEGAIVGQADVGHALRG